MRKVRFILITVLFLALMLTLFAVRNFDGYFTNLYDMTDTYHEFAIFNSYLESITGLNPVKKVKFPIINGNYYGNPTRKEFDRYLNHCKYNPKHFNYQYYTQLANGGF